MSRDPVTYRNIDAAARQRGLAVLGGFHPGPADAVPGGCATMLLLGPDEPRFWPLLTGSGEWRDGAPDPVDRWSTRVIGDWAQELSATALFPFGGAPYHPFFSWALRCGRVHASPIRLLVHDTAGLFVSFRGALALSEHLSLPETAPSPCLSCHDQPCRGACPVDAFDGLSYDVEGCKMHLDRPEGGDCMSQGCRARRACPISRSFGRTSAQSAYHMAVFKG